MSRNIMEILFSAISVFPLALDHKTVYQGPKLVSFCIEWLSFVSYNVGVICKRNYTWCIHNSTPPELVSQAQQI